MRIQFTDGTSMDLPENDTVQIVTAGPGEAPQEGWVKISGDASPALFGTTAKFRAAALQQGQKVLTFRGVLEVTAARRM